MNTIQKTLIAISILLNIIAIIIIVLEIFGIRSWIINELNTPIDSNYPITRFIGWDRNDKWETIDLSAKFNHENFCLTNAKSTINIKAKVKVYNEKEWLLKIDRIFINQRYVKENDRYIGLIEITPKFDCVQDKNPKEFNIYEIVLNEPIENRYWGENFYRVLLGDKIANLKTLQLK